MVWDTIFNVIFLTSINTIPPVFIRGSIDADGNKVLIKFSKDKQKIIVFEKQIPTDIFSEV